MWEQFPVYAYVYLCLLLVKVVLGSRTTGGAAEISFLGVVHLEEL